MRIVVTGADGFLGRNLTLRLRESGRFDVVPVTRATPASALSTLVHGADFLFHLAGVNRPRDPAEFAAGNAGFTHALCEAISSNGRAVPVAFASSTQACLDTPYGSSKRQAETILLAHAARSGASVYILRLTNVFGKWSRPNYNSVIATFCHNVARGQPITVHDPSAPLKLVYVDDVVGTLLQLLETPPQSGFVDVGPVHETTVGEVAKIIHSFAESRRSLTIPRVGEGLIRALHATYLSYLPPEEFDYDVTVHADPRGEFVEMLKTEDSGQFSYFTAHPGITRGEHYHHSKNEKFLVIRGTARFGFRHVITGERWEIVTRGGDARIVETAPGWAHNVTNIGQEELICLLWANEIFDRSHPDTIPARVDP